MKLQKEVICPLAELSDTGLMEGFRKVKKKKIKALKRRLESRKSRVMCRVDVPH